MREEITVDSLLVILIYLPWQSSCCSSPLFIYIVSFSSARIRFSKWCAVPPILFTSDPQSFAPGVASWSIALKLLQHCQLQRIVATEVTFSSVLCQDLMLALFASLKCLQRTDCMCIVCMMCACIYTIMYCDLCMHISIEPYTFIFACCILYIYNYIFNYI